MNLLLINPNSTAAMTGSIATAARSVAAPGTEIVAVQPTFGPASIEGHYDDVFAAAGVLEQLRTPAGQGADAVVIACFGDPGLDAAREATAAPVIGCAEAAFHMASLLATRFSVVTTMTRTCVIAEHLLLRYGMERRCAGVHGTDIPVLALEDGGDAVLAQLEDRARAALVRDRSGAIVLGCAGMAGWCSTLQQRLGVPVIDGVAAAVKLCEALVGLGLRTSKQGDYAQPLPKLYRGWAGPLGWSDESGTPGQSGQEGESAHSDEPGRRVVGLAGSSGSRAGSVVTPPPHPSTPHAHHPPPWPVAI